MEDHPKSTVNPEDDYVDRNARMLIVITSIGFAFVFIYNLLLSRLLSPEDYGDFKVAAAFVSLSQVGVLLGGGVAALRFLPSYISGSDRAAVWEYVRFYLLVLLGLSLLVIVGMAFASYLHDGPVDLQHRHPLVFAAIVVPAAGAMTLVKNTALAAKSLALAYIPYWIAYPLISMALIGLVYLVKHEVTDIDAVLVLFFVNFLILIYIWLRIHRSGIMPLRRANKLAAPKIWLQVSMPMMFIGLTQLLIAQTNIFMLEIVGKEIEVGLFGACAAIAAVFVVVQSSVSGVVVPLMTETAEAGRDRIAALNRKGWLRLMITGLPLFLLIELFAAEILGLFGPSYPQAATALRILIAAFFVQTTLFLPPLWLRYSGFENQVLVVLIVEALMIIGLNFWLIPIYGVTGAALSTVISISLGRIAMAIMMRRYMGVTPLNFSQSTGAT